MPQDQHPTSSETSATLLSTAQPLTKPESKVLQTLLSGGKLRGMYMFGRNTTVGAGRFEILTAKQVAAEEKNKLMQIGTHKAVDQAIVEQLAFKGYIEIPRSQGPHNRIATAKILRNLHSI